jgi:hypothetical protein
VTFGNQQHAQCAVAESLLTRCAYMLTDRIPQCCDLVGFHLPIPGAQRHRSCVVFQYQQNCMRFSGQTGKQLTKVSKTWTEARNRPVPAM